MSGYGKHFSSMYTGSMYGAGPVKFAVWGWVIAHCADGTVELNPKVIAAQLGADVIDIKDAIDWLCTPDDDSRNSDEGGRRLVHDVAFSYRVVSHELYRQKGGDEDKRAYWRRKQAEHRAKKTRPVNDVNDMSNNSGDSPASVTASDLEGVQGEGDNSIRIPCPKDLRLTDDQVGIAEMQGISLVAVEAITAAYVSGYLSKPGERRTIEKWLSGLSRAVHEHGRAKTIELNNDPGRSDGGAAPGDSINLDGVTVE